MCCSSRSSSPSSPASRSCMIAAAVNVFVIEPTRYCVSAVASCSPSTFARPNASCQTSSPFPIAAALTDGIRSPVWASRTRRDSSATGGSGCGKRLQRRGNDLDRSVDVVVGDVEMSHGPHDGRVHGGRDKNPAVPQALDRTGPIRPDVDLDEVRLDLLEIDRNSSSGEPLGEAASACMVLCNSVDVVVD